MREEDLPLGFLEEPLEPFDLKDWFERRLRADDILFCMSDCVEDRKVL